MENNQNTKQKIRQLEEMAQIISKKTNDYQKALELSDYYTKMKKYEKAYADLSKKAKIHEDLKEYIPVIENVGKVINLYEQNKIFSTINYYQNFYYYFENYEYSTFVINYYVTSNNTDILEIYESLGINESIFNMCLTVVKELNPTLYEKYEEKQKKNITVKYEKVKKQITYLYEQIKSAKEKGAKYSKIDFLINMPFAKKEKSRHSFFELQTINSKINTIPNTIYGKILLFAESEMPEMVPTLKEYMMENKLYRIPEFTKKELRKTYHLDSYTIKDEIGNEVILTQEKIDAIINYMEKNNYPFIIEIFVELQKKYVENTLKLENTSKKLVKTLIP